MEIFLIMTFLLFIFKVITKFSNYYIFISYYIDLFLNIFLFTYN